MSTPRRQYYRKNAHGLPATDGEDSENSVRSFYNREEEEDEEQETTTTTQESTEEESSPENELDPDEVAAALDETKQEASEETQEEDPTAILRSELDRLKHEKAVLEGRLAERKTEADQTLRERASQTTSDEESEEEEPEEYLDWTNPQISKKIADVVRDEPEKLTVLMKAVEDQAIKKAERSLKEIREYIDNQKNVDKQLDVARRLQANVVKAFDEAASLGEYERAIVQHTRKMGEEGRAQETKLYKVLTDNPELIRDPSRIVLEISKLARQARENHLRAKANTEGRPVVKKAGMAESGKAVDRSRQLSESGKPTPEDEGAQIFEEIKRAGQRDPSLDSFFKR